MLRCNLISLGIIGAGALAVAVTTSVVSATQSDLAPKITYELAQETSSMTTAKGENAPVSFMFEQPMHLATRHTYESAVSDEMSESPEASEKTNPDTAEMKSKVFPKGFEIEEYADIYEVQINKSYDIPAEFYYDTLPSSMHPIIESICALEEDADISSMFLIAVAATEVGWGEHFYETGSNNWFNWTADTISYQWFDSAEDCVRYTGEKFEERFFNPEWYMEYGQVVDDFFIVSEVNTRYALTDPDTVNWEWTEVVVEIMYTLNSKYQAWREAEQ